MSGDWRTDPRVWRDAGVFTALLEGVIAEADPGRAARTSRVLYTTGINSRIAVQTLAAPDSISPPKPSGRPRRPLRPT
ncbi:MULTISPECIES: hypothetical protein [Streptomyces]|jgi:hypothetical protein|uniref:Uncharacterized protein n=1 Tax=Streptomyces sp. 900129855 TaxID=3155129 RepID=A0ABV2ZZA8_9ACTN